jgi:enterobacterial common antigen flippase
MASVSCSNELASSPSESSPPPTTAAVPPINRSYGQILKSSALVGGSSVLNIGVGIVRTKAMAMLLGPAGVGLFGLYGSIADLTQSIAGFGINSSGVRQIAEAASSGDKIQIARTAAVLRRTSTVLGVLGTIFLLLFSRQVSKLTFGTAERAASVSLLSIAVLFRLVSAGQGALIQGMRRIADLAKMSVLGAMFGACTSILLVYLLREDGVVPSLVSVAAMTILTSWWYSRKIEVKSTTVTLTQLRQETLTLLKLGSAFMASGFMTMGVGYVVRATILHKIGVEATGFYQSAWNLGGFYVSIILGAMGADFYPRLTASINDHQECNRLVNEQMLVGLLLAGPGVLATLTFTPVVIAAFYSAKFAAAVAVLRWVCLGTTLQVITWPMGFIIVAKNNQMIFILAELAWTIVAIGLAYICVTAFGVNGAGIAFFGSYVFHGLLIYPIVRKLSGFRWSSDSLRVGLVYCSSIGIVFCSFYLFTLSGAVSIGTIMLCLTAIYSVRTLLRLVSNDEIPRPIRLLLSLCTFSERQTRLHSEKR